MPKILIQDWLAQTSGKEEQELPVDKTIRFEIPTGNISVSIQGGEVVIRKTGGLAGDDQIQIKPQVTNAIIIK